MDRGLIALAVFLLGTSISACSQESGSVAQQKAAGAAEVQTQTQGYGGDYQPLGQGDHHR